MSFAEEMKALADKQNDEFFQREQKLNEEQEQKKKRIDCYKSLIQECVREEASKGNYTVDALLGMRYEGDGCYSQCISKKCDYIIRFITPEEMKKIVDEENLYSKEANRTYDVTKHDKASNRGNIRYKYRSRSRSISLIELEKLRAELEEAAQELGVTCNARIVEGKDTYEEKYFYRKRGFGATYTKKEEIVRIYVKNYSIHLSLSIK